MSLLGYHLTACIQWKELKQQRKALCGKNRPLIQYIHACLPFEDLCLSSNSLMTQLCAVCVCLCKDTGPQWHLCFSPVRERWSGDGAGGEQVLLHYVAWMSLLVMLVPHLLFIWINMLRVERSRRPEKLLGAVNKTMTYYHFMKWLWGLCQQLGIYTSTRHAGCVKIAY